VSGVQEGWQNYFALQQIRQDNESLRQEVAQLRIALQQERARISRTELKEGDLIFFNTRGGISHVGVYLQNNKFVHASTSGGVVISDIFDEYWARKFVGVGRLRNKESLASSAGK
jgi:lipoprotein Spr